MVLSMGGFAVAVSGGVVPTSFVALFDTVAATFEVDEDGALGGVVIVRKEDIDPDVDVEVDKACVCPGGTTLCLTSDITVKEPDVVSEDGGGPVTKGVGYGPVPVMEVGDTVCAMVAVVLPAWSIRYVVS